MEYYNQDYLAHYGVKGMKWGVRKASLYVKTNNRLGENYSENYKNKMTKQARKLLRKNINDSNFYARITGAQEYVNKANISRQRLSDIDSGKMKAGRDFVTNSEFAINPLFYTFSRDLTFSNKTNNNTDKSVIAMLTQDEAKRLGLGDSTRITGQEEAEFWKEYAKQFA